MRFGAATLLLMTFLSSLLGSGELPPDFEIYGHAAGTVGGRGGDLYRVTDLGDGDGPGTIRDAVSRPNRYVVFEVSGDIVLRGDLKIAQPNLTIDGSTAPDGGVQFRGGYGLILMADELIVRHVRIRPGPHPARRRLERDCITIDRGTNIVIDHVSCSWATDEGISSWGRVWPIRNLTVQWSIIAEGLVCPPANRPHCLESGGGSYGGLLEGDLDRITLYRNLYAHNVSRNPLLLDGPLYDPPRYSPGPGILDVPRISNVQIVQNVIFHYLTAIDLSSESRRGILRADVVDNVLKWGPAWAESGRPMRPRFTTHPKVGVRSRPAGRRQHNGRLDLYLRGNVSPRRNPGQPECRVFQTGSNLPCDGEATPPADLARDQPLEPVFERVPAGSVLAEVLERAGATQPCRDAVDARIVRETETGTGLWIDDPEEVGGWPNLQLPCADPDGAGTSSTMAATSG
jgi:hypothetical protein